MMNEKNILILGAGPAGMSCAMGLLKSEYKLDIIEKENKIGGLAKTLRFKEGDYLFRTDIGPHRFFSKNQQLYGLIGDLLKEDWIVIPRLTRQHIQGKFYDYPINAMQAFKNIGVINSIKIVKDFILAIIKYRVFKKKIINFEDYITANFGRALGELNMLNYTEKIWGIPCSQIHPDWAKQRIKGLNLLSALKNAIFKKGTSEGPKTLVDHFYYPRYGTGSIYDAMSKKIMGEGNKIKTNSYPTQIKHSNRNIVEIELNVNGEKQTVNPDIIVESIPPKEFLSLLSPSPPENVINSVNKLRWRSQVYLFITLDKDRITKDNWIYFPDKEIPFGRVMEPRNFSKEMSPEGKTSLFVEFFVFENDKIWNMPEKELFNLTIEQFEKLGFLKREEVRSHYLIKRKNIYPVYDLDYQKHLHVVKDYLAGFKNLFYIGRRGRFKYNNQDHSLEMGIMAAKSIIDGKRYDIENCGSEDEYFEKGRIKTQEGSIEKKSYNWMILEDRGER